MVQDTTVRSAARYRHACVACRCTLSCCISHCITDPWFTADDVFEVHSAQDLVGRKQNAAVSSDQLERASPVLNSLGIGFEEIRRVSCTSDVQCSVWSCTQYRIEKQRGVHVVCCPREMIAAKSSDSIVLYSTRDWRRVEARFIAEQGVGLDRGRIDSGWTNLPGSVMVFVNLPGGSAPTKTSPSSRTQTTTPFCCSKSELQ